MKNEFALAFNEVLEEKQLPKDVILKAIESAMVSAYRKSVNASTAQLVEAVVDPDTGKVTISAEKEVVDEVQDDRTEVVLDVAQQYDPEAELGSMVVVESTPKDFGRVAAQTARQVIQQRIRDAERLSQLNHYQKQLGEIISGVIQAINSQGLTIGLEMRAEGTMLKKDMIPGERFRIHDRIRCLVSEIKDTPRGPQILLSRTHRDFLRRLLENEVPEIFHGVVEIRSISREPGERAKVAVAATQSGIDPVGACVGIRGVRIQAIVRELHDEKIDVIEWNQDPAAFIAKAISPARVVGVYLNNDQMSGKTATVVVPEDQLSLAIGRDGQNARLAAKLTSWRIDIKSVSEAAADALYRLQNNPDLAELAEEEKENYDTIETLLTRKAEGRPLNPEDYDKLSGLIDRVESFLSTYGKEEEEAEVTVSDDELRLREELPEELTTIRILESDLNSNLADILNEAGFNTIADLSVGLKLHPDDILKLQGIGPKAMADIALVVDSCLQKYAPAKPEIEVDLAAEEPDTVLDVETVEEAAALVEEVIQIEEKMAEEPVIEETLTKKEPVEEVIEEEISFEEIFTLKPELLDPMNINHDSEDESDESLSTAEKAKKKKRKHQTIEYDPDADLVIKHKKHKRGGGGEWDWEL
ncbi:MAG: transcription termination/antitermination protein NusA [Anaerolineaceae bacterium]|nr:transcription termination/antitermination protein NusA [Anaerolineaceae bacterium]